MSIIFEVVGTFVWHEGCERLTEYDLGGFDSSCSGFALHVLEFGEDLLDQVQVGGIFRQEEQLGVNRADQCSYGLTFVATEIVHDEMSPGVRVGSRTLST